MHLRGPMPTFVEQFMTEFEPEMKKTRKLLEAIPDHDPNFKPHEKSMPLNRLAGHVADLPRWIAVTIETDHLAMEPGEGTKYYYLEKNGRDALLAKFDEHVAQARAALASTNDQHLAGHWKFIYAGHTVLDMSRTLVLTDVCKNHLIHHRAQLTVYVRLLGGKVPGLYGPSADEQ